jgi:hypothetical protein
MNGRFTVIWRLRMCSIVFGTALLGWLATGAMAAQYGTAVVEQGEMTILRDGKSISFKASPQSVSVNEKDLVRVRDASRIVLKTQDRATLTLGANAVFQCEPWQAPNSNTSGMFRMLFGRFRATVSGLAGTDRFNVKTATATIGVKGTIWDQATTVGGNTVVVGVESNVETSGSDGVGQNVGPNQVSTVIGNNPASQSVNVPEELREALRNLNSPPINSPGALNLPVENILIEKGIVS